jgi:hypothetical protein
MLCGLMCITPPAGRNIVLPATTFNPSGTFGFASYPPVSANPLQTSSTDSLDF